MIPTQQKPAPRDRTDLHTQVVDALRHIVRAIRVGAQAAETRLGISGAQLFVLQQVAQHPAASLGDIARATLTDQSSVSVVVARLVRNGLLSRRVSARDARRIQLSLTARGHALLARAPESAQAKLAKALRTLPAGRLKAVAVALPELARALGAPDQPPEMFFERRRRRTARTRNRRPSQ